VGTSSATPPALSPELRCCIDRLKSQSEADIHIEPGSRREVRRDQFLVSPS
jgi:hypothetical protein